MNQFVMPQPNWIAKINGPNYTAGGFLKEVTHALLSLRPLSHCLSLISHQPAASQPAI